MENNTTNTWSTFTVKAFDEDARIIKGIASTPSTDRDGDIIDAMGAQFKLPFPLLSQHDINSPIGEVIKAVATKEGIAIEAHIAKDSGLGYVDATWKKIKAGLIKGLSIGFRPIEAVAIDTGIHFKKYEIFELSAVTVPANMEASIHSVKHLCTDSCKTTSVEIEAKRAEVVKRADATMARTKIILRKVL